VFCVSGENLILPFDPSGQEELAECNRQASFSSNYQMRIRIFEIMSEACAEGIGLAIIVLAVYIFH
jgi:hypothetical protein